MDTDNPYQVACLDREIRRKLPTLLRRKLKLK